LSLANLKSLRFNNEDISHNIRSDTIERERVDVMQYILFIHRKEVYRIA